jgi:hypothetical protein
MKKETSNTDSIWEISTNRYVAFIDIMGFKDMVARTPHIDIYDLMKRIESKKKYINGIGWKGNKSELVRTTTYSDSIMLYSKEDSYDSLYSLICTVAAFTNELFLECIPHKGAIAYGFMTLDTENSIYFGQPLIDAYLLQEELYFYGIVVHASAENEMEIFKKEDLLIPFCKNYLCPFKNGSSEHLAIIPITAGIYLSDDINNDEEDAEAKNSREKLFESIKNLRFKTSGHLRKYIDNTKLYLGIH